MESYSKKNERGNYHSSPRDDECKMHYKLNCHFVVQSDHYSRIFLVKTLNLSVRYNFYLFFIKPYDVKPESHT